MKLSGLSIGAEHTITYAVSDQNLVHRFFPGVLEFSRKPAVMATGWLVGVCEWPAMEALRDYMTDTQCSLGMNVMISHLAPVLAGTTLEVSARCVEVDRAFSEWAVRARDEHELVASGVVSFIVVEFENYVSRRLTPKVAQLNGGDQALVGARTA